MISVAHAGETRYTSEMKFPALFASSLVLFTGCSSPQVWYQPGKTAAEAWRDYGAARNEAQRTDNPYTAFAGLGGYLRSQSNKGSYADNAMLSKGYLPAPQKEHSDYPKK